jgi:amino acid adenylation domain-containing protein
VINTSGSTGTPKGVALNHRSFIDFTEWSVREGLVREGEVIGCLSPLVFDIYSFELCMLMAKGCTMVIVPERFAAFPARILQLLRQREVSFIFWVPTIMVNIANMDLLAQIPLPRLKTVWFAGEVFPTQKFNYWRRMLPGAAFVNLYGPIEITLDCTAYRIERELADSEPIPIGYPCRNTDILILKEDDTPAAPGEDGELCVRGSSLAMGYYNNPEKTAEVFVQNPLNRSYPERIYRTGDIVFVNARGEMVFKGRRDTLIKHMGYRIELAEIEHVLVDTLGIAANCCAVYDAAKKEIVLFYEAASPLDAAELRKRIGGILPRYMIPAAYRHMPELPRNTNGKIDRLLLKEELY